MMGMYQIAIGSEDNDMVNYGDCCNVVIGSEYTGNKQDWNSGPWENPLYYPTFMLSGIEGPPLSGIINVKGILNSQGLSLSARPNPFNGSTTLHFNVEQIGTLGIFNLKGQLLQHFSLKAGTGWIVWDGRVQKGLRCAPGKYVACLKSGKQIKTLKLIIGN
jgi:hypothetical protein